MVSRETFEAAEAIVVPTRSQRVFKAVALCLCVAGDGRMLARCSVALVRFPLFVCVADVMEKDVAGLEKHMKVSLAFTSNESAFLSSGEYEAAPHSITVFEGWKSTE